MAGKKDQSKEIKQNPFKRLKGFCVPPSDKMRPSAKKVEPLPETKIDETDLFASEMARLGVTHCAEADASLAEDADNGMEPVSNGAVASFSSDRDLFLSSLGTLEAVFIDEIPVEEEISAAPRRMRQVRRGELVPEAKLDLHGLARTEARERVCHFLDNSVYHGFKTVLIVTGRGKGSGGEPVLRSEIERFLRHEATAWVLEWGRAPARYGGEGALVIFLKGRKQGK